MKEYRYGPDTCPGHVLIMEGTDGINQKKYVNGICKRCGFKREALPNSFDASLAAKRKLRTTNSKSKQQYVWDIKI